MPGMLAGLLPPSQDGETVTTRGSPAFLKAYCVSRGSLITGGPALPKRYSYPI